MLTLEVIRRSPGAVVGMLMVLLSGSILTSLLLGSNPISPSEVYAGLFDPARDTDAVVWGSRIPRTVLAAVVGACLGLAGAVMQGQTRNPLADPGIFGVSAGASLAVVVAAYGFAVTDAGTTIWFALFGALAASVIVFAIAAAGSATASPVPLALAGSVVSALIGAVVSFLVLTDEAGLNAFRVWVVGSLSGHTLTALSQVWPFAVIGIVLAFAGIKGMDSLALGTDVARGLGERILRIRLIGLGAVTLLTATAIAVAGPIAFIGLTAPHLARALVGVTHVRLVPVSALAGAVVLLAADSFSRVIGGTAEIPVGVALSVLGGVVFVVVVRRTRAVSL